MAPRKKAQSVPAYPMHLYRDADSGDWVAQVVDLPGCIGVGDSPVEAVGSAMGNVAVWLEGARENGWAVPQPKQPVEASGRLQLRLPPVLHSRLQQLAEAEGVSINQQIVSAVSEYLGAGKLYTTLAERLERIVVAATRRGAATVGTARLEPIVASQAGQPVPVSFETEDQVTIANWIVQ
jgi:antitoxin HicB